MLLFFSSLSVSLPFLCLFSGVCPSNSSALLDSGTSNKSTRKDWPTAFTDVNANDLQTAYQRRALCRWAGLLVSVGNLKTGSEAAATTAAQSDTYLFPLSIENIWTRNIKHPVSLDGATFNVFRETGKCFLIHFNSNVLLTKFKTTNLPFP